MVHVLVVEDDKDTRECLRMALQDDGYQASEATNGEEALDNLRASPAPVVVVLDIVMSPTDGIGVLKAVQADAALASRHGYLVLTAVPLERLALPDDLSCLLAVPPIRKPFNLDVLMDAIAQATTRLPAPSEARAAS